MRKVYRVSKEDLVHAKNRMPIGFFDSREAAEDCISRCIKRDEDCEVINHKCICYFIEEEYRSDSIVIR